MLLGIDLGTTFCCVALIADDGRPAVIPGSDGSTTTPSVLWFDGRTAVVGGKANARKQLGVDHHIYEFVKRNVGRPIDDPTGSYLIGGYAWGAAGMSALILRKLKKDAIRYFKRTGALPSDTEEKDVELDAMITVPAHFGDAQRQEMHLAGYAAGLNVVGIVNEPTAAALAYGLTPGRGDRRRILVFDLGGGTCDVTVLEMRGEQAVVLASDGNHAVGGTDWDHLIMEEICQRVRTATGTDLPLDRTFDVQQLAIAAKHELTGNQETLVVVTVGDDDIEVRLDRESFLTTRRSVSLKVKEAEGFDFEGRSTELLKRCEALCRSVVESAVIEAPSGRRALTWADLDDVVLAGGASRMPMVAAMMERVTGRRIERAIPGFDPDTAIAIGAALHGHNRRSVIDVVAKTIGIRVEKDGRRPAILPLVAKNTHTPIEVARILSAPENALLDVYEGESEAPDECEPRGSLELENHEGEVRVVLRVNEDGRIEATVEQSPQPPRTLLIRNELFRTGPRARELRERVMAVALSS